MLLPWLHKAIVLYSILRIYLLKWLVSLQGSFSVRKYSLSSKTGTLLPDFPNPRLLELPENIALEKASACRKASEGSYHAYSCFYCSLRSSSSSQSFLFYFSFFFSSFFSKTIHKHCENHNCYDGLTQNCLSLI